jgi:CheY-like chemotaxis protein
MQRRRILVVDDDDTVRDAVAMMLRLDDHEVDTARNREEALGLLGQGSYDVIVSDLGMPSLDGPLFYRELKRGHPETLERLIFMTGHTAPEYASFLKETGVPVLAKPFTAEDLREAVQRALATL